MPRKARRFGEAAVRLHEMEVGLSRQAGRDAVDIAAQHRRQISVDHRRVAAPDQLDQRRDLVADRDLRKAQLARDLRQPRLVIADAPAVHQDDRQRVDPRIANRCLAPAAPATSSSGTSTSPSTPTRSSISTTRSYSIDGKHDVPREDLRPRLVADPQRIAEAARDRQRDPLALALEQRVGRDGRAHPHLGDRAAFLGEHAPDRLERGIVILAGILRQQLLDPQPPVATSARRRR